MTRGTTRFVALCLGVGALTAGFAAAGPLAPPTGPVAPTMKPLDQVEPRTPIGPDTTPGDATALFVIDKPGSYYLVGNIVADPTLHGVRIASSHVSLDLSGFTIDGTGTVGSLHGVTVTPGIEHIVVRNGFVRNWSRRGLDLDGSTANRIEGVHVSGCASIGIFTGGGGSVVRDCTATDCLTGIQARAGTAIERCVSHGNSSTGIAVFDDSVVRDCVALDNGVSGVSASGPRVVVERCTLNGNLNGVRVPGGVSEVRIADNTLIGNTNGIVLDGSDNTISGNTVRGGTPASRYIIAAGNHLNIVVSELPQTISWPARVTLEGDLTGSSGLIVASSDVHIDLCGHRLNGVGATGSGIDVSGFGRRNISVRNGSVSGWQINGVSLAVASSGVIERVQASDNLESGIMAGRSFSVVACAAENNGVNGITALDGSTITASTAKGNALMGFRAQGGVTVTDCAAEGNAFDGFNIGPGATLSRATSSNNGSHGVFAEIGCTIENSTITGNTFGGVRALARCTIRDNLINLNGVDDVSGGGPGILTEGDGARIDGNNLVGNRTGISVLDADNFIARNTVRASVANNYSIGPGNHYGEILTPGAGFSASAWANFSH